MAKNIRFMTSKERLSKFRNLTKGRLMVQKESINNLLQNLPEGCKSLSDDEKDIFRTLRECYHDILSTWDYRSKELLKQINNNQ